MSVAASRPDFHIGFMPSDAWKRTPFYRENSTALSGTVERRNDHILGHQENIGYDSEEVERVGKEILQLRREIEQDSQQGLDTRDKYQRLASLQEEYNYWGFRILTSKHSIFLDRREIVEDRQFVDGPMEYIDLSTQEKGHLERYLSSASQDHSWSLLERILHKVFRETDFDRRVIRAFRSNGKNGMGPLMKIVSMFSDGPSMETLQRKLAEKMESTTDPLTLEIYQILQDAAKKMDLYSIMVNFYSLARADMVSGPLEKIQIATRRATEHTGSHRIYLARPQADFLSRKFVVIREADHYDLPSITSMGSADSESMNSILEGPFEDVDLSESSVSRTSSDASEDRLVSGSHAVPKTAEKTGPSLSSRIGSLFDSALWVLGWLFSIIFFPIAIVRLCTEPAPVEST